ncbi:MAG: hypothetical protein OEW87_06950 [Flavobacteriaceae bacterium]|nr:hypothetical protein [Flavobacteriaceae bacterium]
MSISFASMLDQFKEYHYPYKHWGPKTNKQAMHLISVNKDILSEANNNNA